MRLINTIGFVAICLASNICFSEPTVIYDAFLNESVSSDKYKNVLKQNRKFTIGSEEDAQKIADSIKKRAEDIGLKKPVQVPIKTNNMMPGKFDSKDAYFPNLTKPIFIIGSDKLSLTWLMKWNKSLKKIGAIGWLIEAKNKVDLENVAKAGNGLTFITLTGEKIPKLFNINTYPVLISARSIEQ